MTSFTLRTLSRVSRFVLIFEGTSGDIGMGRAVTGLQCPVIGNSNLEWTVFCLLQNLLHSFLTVVSCMLALYILWVMWHGPLLSLSGLPPLPSCWSRGSSCSTWVCMLGCIPQRFWRHGWVLSIGQMSIWQHCCWCLLPCLSCVCFEWAHIFQTKLKVLSLSSAPGGPGTGVGRALYAAGLSEVPCCSGGIVFLALDCCALMQLFSPWHNQQDCLCYSRP